MSPGYGSDIDNFSSALSPVLCQQKKTTELPSGFPSQLISPLAWRPEEILERRHDTILELSEDDLVEINNALENFDGMAPCY